MIDTSGIVAGIIVGFVFWAISRFWLNVFN